LKKILSVFLAVIMVVFMFPSGVIRVTALQSGDYQYDVNTDGVSCTITGYIGAGGNITIPSILGTYCVTSIGQEAFYNCTGLKSINIPSSVTTIMNFLYIDFSKLTQINIDTANPSYSSLDGVLFDKNKTTLIQYPCGKIGDYVIPNSVTTIGDEAFGECTGLTSITIPNSVTTIGFDAFFRCTGLISVTIPNSMTTIGDNSFCYCTRLTSVTIPNSIITIGEAAFDGCSGLTSITIPNSVTTIEDAAFGECTGLTSITIPNSVTTIGELTFEGCSKLTSITIPNGVTTISSRTFYNCSGLTSITIPSSVTNIGNNAFYGCNNVTIFGILGSYAEGYAEKNGIPFVSHMIASKNNTGCIVDYANMFIYGLISGATSLNGYIKIANGYQLSYSPNGVLGTGTILNVIKDGVTVETYTIVLYGDDNGDGNIDSIDAGTAVDYQNYMVNWDPVKDAAFIKAADVNGDGNIDSIDAGVMVDVQNYMLTINQGTGLALMPTLIDGTVNISGTAKYGNTLTADISNIMPTNATFTYMWKSGGNVIGTDSTYIVTANDIGKSITVTVTGFGVYSGGIRSSAVIPTKADSITPLAPILSSETPNSVTLIAVSGQEYKFDGGDWQSSAIFTGLNPNTSYNFYTRIAETDTQYASGISTALNVTTYENELSGTISIIGVAQYGNTLTEDISTISPTTATLSYQWKRGTVIIGTNSTYTISIQDIGQPITVTVSGIGDYDGSITSSVVTPTSVNISGIVKIIGTAQYGVTLTADISGIVPSTATLSYQWKRGEVIVGNNLTYTISVDDIGQSLSFTVAGTDGYAGSITSTAVIPVKLTVSTPAAPILSSETSNSVTLIAVSGQEYRVNTGTWQSSAVFTGLSPNTTYNFYTRVEETDTQYASGISTALSVTTNKISITGAVAIAGNTTVGATLSADISGVIPVGATLSYAWKEGSVIIGTGSTYTVIDADIGASITVTVTGTGNYLGSIKSPAKVITA